MATARTLSLGWQETTTWRNFQTAVLLALAAAGVGALFYLVETYVLGSRHRFAERPAEVVMQALGLAHFLIGWLFMATSPRLRSASALARVGGLTLVGAALCFASWSLGGIRHPFVVMAFYAYFLVHEMGDQANLYVNHGDAPPAAGRDDFIAALRTTTALGLMTVFLLIYTLFGRVQDRLERVVADAEPWLAVLLGVLAAATAAAAWRARRCLRQGGVELGAYAPLLAVYASIAVILVFGSLLGSFGFTLIVLIHVMSWLVFVQQRLAGPEAGSSARRGLWPWLRTTPAGFLTLHLVLAGVLLAILAIRVHVWQRAGYVSQALSGSTFHYWAILHITIAFWRK